MARQVNRRQVLGGAATAAAAAAFGGALPRASLGSSAAKRAATPISFSYMLPDEYYQWLIGDQWFYTSMPEVNANIKLVDGPLRANYYQKIDLTINSNDLPDAFIVDQAQVAIYGAQGAFIDLKPLIKQHAPNIQKFIDSNSNFKGLITNNGKIFGIVKNYPKITFVTFYRQDMFEKAGVSPDSALTIKGFTSALQTLKSSNKSTANYFPYLGRGNGPDAAPNQFFTLQYAFNAQDTVDSKGKVHGIYDSGGSEDIHSAGFKQMIEWYASLYDNGLVDPEFIAGTVTEEQWQTKMLTSKGTVSDDFWTRPAWFMDNGGPQDESGYQIAVLPAFKADNGKQLRRPVSAEWSTDQYMVVGAKSKKAVDVLRYLDFLYSERGNNLMVWGVEGKSYTVKNGIKQYVPGLYEKADAAQLGVKEWNFIQDRLTFNAPVNNTAYYQWGDPLIVAFAAKYFGSYSYSLPVLKYSPSQLQTRTKLLANVEPFIAAQVVLFVSGKRPFSQWQDFLDQADKMGNKRIEQIDQAAYDATVNTK